MTKRMTENNDLIFHCKLLKTSKKISTDSKIETVFFFFLISAKIILNSTHITYLDYNYKITKHAVYISETNKIYLTENFSK